MNFLFLSPTHKSTAKCPQAPPAQDATDPEPTRVLDILQLRDHWGGDDELETFDFTLPDEATQYVISVRFDDAGEIEEISMES